MPRCWRVRSGTARCSRVAVCRALSPSPSSRWSTNSTISLARAVRHIIAKMIDVHSGSQTNALVVEREGRDGRAEAAVVATYLYEWEAILLHGHEHFRRDRCRREAGDVAAQLPWLQDGMEVKLRMMSGKALSVVLPKTGVYECARRWRARAAHAWAHQIRCRCLWRWATVSSSAPRRRRRRPGSYSVENRSPQAVMQ